MASFADKNGKTWPVSLTVGHIDPLKETFQFDPSRYIKTDKEFAKLYDLEPQVVVGILWIICEEAGTKDGLTPEAWAHLFDGDSLEGAVHALADAVIGFFPRKAISQAMQRNLSKMLQKMDETVCRKLDQKMNQKLEQMATILEDTAGNSAE